MSRALDKEVLQALSRSDPEKIYDDIADLLDTPRDDGLLLEIEILGKGQPLIPDLSFLIDRNAVGIPKVRIFQAFSAAYKRFQEYILRVGPQQAEQRSAELLRSTAVLLLVDPEHLTAVNTRKRAILQIIQDSGDAKASLEREKWFVDSLLTSRLHRHTKSPILWSHRRWILSLYRNHGLPVDVPFGIRTIILVSGERHPRNYYAWDHARWLVRAFVDGHGDEVRSLQGMVADVKDWCLKHHDDISGWAFLHHLLRKGGTGLDSDRSCAFQGILQMAESFRWTNESVWWFIHAMAATSLLTPEDLSLLEETGGRMFGLGPDGSGGDGLSKKWFRSFRETQAA